MDQGQILNRRYEIVRPLGEGGSGSVYLARDLLKAGHLVALKILRPEGVDPAAIDRFKEEFRSMARLRHPNLALVHEFGTLSGDGRHFLSMEYLEGRELASFAFDALADRIDSLVVQCLRALDYIHARGLLHNDIKPQNILVCPPFRVKLLDFGLARRIDAGDPGALSGTVHYIAPERITPGHADVRSDLYALGVVLYQILTSVLPHEGPDAGAVVRSILSGAVRPPRTLNGAIPPRVESFLMTLLARDPGARPRSAAAALAILNEGAPVPQSLDTPETRACFATSGRFVGRDEELADLVRLATAHAGSGGADDTLPRLVVILGPSGIGKSRLFREVRHRMQLAGLRCLTGACYQDQGGSFQGFTEALRQARPGELQPLHRRALERVLPSAVEAASATIPALTAASVPASAPTVALEEIDSEIELGKEDLIVGVSGALDFLGKDGPGVLFLEDGQWLDQPGADLVNHTVLRPRRGPWLLIASAREDELSSAPLGDVLKGLARSPRLRSISLAPLGREAIVDLVASMLPFDRRPDTLAGLLEGRTDGNPLFIEETIAALTDAGALRRQGETWVASADSLDVARLPPSLVNALGRRLAALSAHARTVAECLAVFNRPVPLALVGRAAGLSPGDIADACADLQALRLVEAEPGEAGQVRVGLAHARVRDALHAELAPGRLRALHLAAGEALEDCEGDALDRVVEDLARHFATAGDRERAIKYCHRASVRARRVFNFAAQIGYLRRLVEFIPADDFPRRLDVLHELAFVSMVELGDYATSEPVVVEYLETARRAGSKVDLARALGCQARLLSFQGKSDEAAQAAERAVTAARQLGRRRLLAKALNTLGIVCARRAENRRALDYFQEAVAICHPARDVDLLMTYQVNLAINLLGLGEPEDALRTLEDALRVARHYGRPIDFYRAQANMGMVLESNGDLTRAMEQIREALEWSHEHVNLEIYSQSLHNLARFSALNGRFDRACVLSAEERAKGEPMGSVPRRIVTLDLYGTILRGLGDTTRAAATHREALALARSLGDRIQEGYVLNELAADELTSGRTSEAEALARDALLIGRELDHPRIQFHAYAIQSLVAAGREDARAVAAARRGLTRVNPRSLRFYDRLHMHLVIGRSALGTGNPADAVREARAGLEAALRGGYREAAWRLHSLLAEALEAQGLRAEAEDSYNEARLLILQIASELEDAAMKDTYKSDPDRRRLLERGVAVPVPAPAMGIASGARSPLERLTTLYEITQAINSILDTKELLNKVMDLAIDMVGAERGLVFLYRSETDEMEPVVARNLEHQTITDATQYSRGILREAGRGRAVLSVDALSDARFRDYRSVSIYQIRSLLCVPLKLKDRVVGTVYVDTRQPGKVFTEDDQRFLEAFASQAAVAVENARLYDQVRQENSYLKAAVNERYGYESIIGRSPQMRAVYQLLSRIAPSHLPVLIQGESGTGKELVARALHQNSPRKDRRFFSENCAALPDTLLESELFGHVKGAFTGADSGRRGLFELADGGTLFLDEVGDMSVTMQSKLLRVLQDGEVRPVGSETTRRVDVRVISASNRDLQALIREKKFREDLFYRLNVVCVRLPALRERRGDIPLLVDHFLARLAQQNKTPKLRIDAALMAELMRHDWPGNVRELENQVYRLALFANGDTLTLADARHDAEFAARMGAAARATGAGVVLGVDGALVGSAGAAQVGGTGAQPAGPGAGPGGRAGTVSLTADDLRRALSQAGGNRDAAARLLGISRATFFRRQKELKVSAPRRSATHPVPAEG